MHREKTNAYLSNAMSTKTKIGLGLLFVPLIFAIPVFFHLFPMGPVLDDVPNPISDKTRVSKSDQEKALPTNPLRNLYFGDLHVHTSLSFDAFIGGTLANPDDAYKFARGEAIEIFGKPVKIERPLDFSAVTDHAEMLGELITIQNPEEPAHNSLLARLFRSIYESDNQIGLDTARQRWLFELSIKRGGSEEKNHPNFFRGFETTTKAWDIILDAADKYYEPGTFTTLAGYEWTHTIGKAHLHRNILFRDMQVPDYPMSSFELRNEQALWKWLQKITDEGATCMAIPHNSNLAEGGAFSDRDENGNPITAEYAQLRQDFEPLAEIHQVKGNSEVHAAFWKNDEFAGFENYTHHPREDNYVRWALKKGLEHEHHHGVNPFKFGLIGSTDTHSGTPGNTEENDEFIGNSAILDFYPEARANAGWALDPSLKVYEVINPGGLVAVWAEANTRGHIYDALKQKECYATSGSRIKLRFFGGQHFSSDLADHEAMLKEGYEKGIAMGGDLPSNIGDSASFLIWAEKDELGANLDRIQVIKGWHKDDELHEKIFNVALSDNRVVNPDGSVLDNGATVNLETGAWSDDKGAESLLVIWKDPEFDPDAKAFYYVRVLEVPTASWQLWDQIRYGTQYPKHVPLTVRERAWSSPIWYSP